LIGKYKTKDLQFLEFDYYFFIQVECIFDSFLPNNSLILVVIKTKKMSKNGIIDGCFLKDGQKRIYVKLTPNKNLFPGYFIPPIKWNGYIQKYEVEIIQISMTAYDQSDFIFKKYPEKFDNLKDN